MAIKNFDTASRRGEAAVVNDIEITFQIDGEDLVAHPPTTGQLALFFSVTDGGMASIRAMLNFFEAILDEEGNDLLLEKLQDGVEISLLSDIIAHLIGEWTGRPTKSSSASSASRKSTGRASTAKPRKQAATRSA